MIFSGGFRGAEPAPAPLGRRTDAVTVLPISENGTVLWRALDFDRSTVKHVLQNTQNHCHQWPLAALSSLQHSPESLAGLRVPYFSGKVEGRKRSKRGGWRGRK